MKIFLTGGTGYIGDQLLKRLLNKGSKVHALCRNLVERDVPAHKNLKWFEGDLLNLESIMHAIEGCEEVYHTAAYARVWAKDTNVYYKQNVTGTENVLEAAYQANVRKVVMTSSAGVIGPWGNIVADESLQRLIPFLNEYEETKALAENVAQEYCKKGLHIVIVSPSRVYGLGKESRSNPTLLLIKSILKRGFVIVPQDRKGIGSYSFIEDVVDGHFLAMEKGRSGERYILGGENISYEHLVKTILKVCNKKVKILTIPEAVIKLYSHWELFRAKISDYEPWIVPKWVEKYKYNAAYSSKKAEVELGYKITPLAEGLTRTIQSI